MQYLQISLPSNQTVSGKEGEGENLKLPCEIVRSARRTMSMQIKEDGGLMLRIPYGMTTRNAMDFAEAHKDWLIRHYRRAVGNRQNRQTYSGEDIENYKKKLRPVLEHRVAYYAQVMDVGYNRITIRAQKTRWGSCSARGNLNFNWKLVLMPVEILDYVVVHELAHRIEMNHSDRFWAQVENILPDYRERRRRLKEYDREMQ